MARLGSCRWIWTGISLGAAAFGTAAAGTTAASASPTSIVLPEGHSWDLAFFICIACMQYSRLLMPIAFAGSSAALAYAGLVVASAFLGARVNAFDLLFLAIGAVPYGVAVIIRCRRVLRGMLYREFGENSDRYVGLITHGVKLPEALGRLAVCTNKSVVTKLKFAMALMSWQELTACMVVTMWALVAFTPEFMIPGRRLPSADAARWFLMQAGFAWRAKLSVGLQLAAAAWGWIWSLHLWCSVWEFCEDLMSLAYMRRKLKEQPGELPLPPKLMLKPGDTNMENENKFRRLAKILAFARRPLALSELYYFLPSQSHFMGMLGTVYGLTTRYLTASFPQQQPPSTWAEGLIRPGAAASQWLHDLMGWSGAAWGGTALVAAAVWGLAKLLTWRKRKAWLDVFCARRFELLVNPDRFFSPRGIDADAIEDTSLLLGPFPSTAARLRSWISSLATVFGCIAWGSLIIGCVRHPGYLPAFGLPAYGDAGVRYTCSLVCPGPEVGAPPGAASGWNCGSGTVGVAAGGGGFAGWWNEVQVAARVNLLAVRVWRRGGLDGVQVAMEALRAAHCADVAGGHGDGQAKHARETLRRLQQTGLADVLWAMGGKWALGMAWERRRAVGGYTDNDDDFDAGGAYWSAAGGGDGDSERAGRGSAADLNDRKALQRERRCAANPFGPGGELSRYCLLEETGRGEGDKGVRGAGKTGGADSSGAQARTRWFGFSIWTQPPRAQKSSSPPAGAAGTLVYTLANLALATALVSWGIVARPHWRKSPERFLDEVTAYVKRMLGPRTSRSGRKLPAASAASRRKTADADRHPRKAQQPRAQGAKSQKQQLAAAGASTLPAAGGRGAAAATSQANSKQEVPAAAARGFAAVGAALSKAAGAAASAAKAPAGSKPDATREAKPQQGGVGPKQQQPQQQPVSATAAPPAVPPAEAAPPSSKPPAKPSAGTSARRHGNKVAVRAGGEPSSSSTPSSSSPAPASAAAAIATKGRPTQNATAPATAGAAAAPKPSSWQQQPNERSPDQHNAGSSLAAAIAAALPFTASLAHQASARPAAATSHTETARVPPPAASSHSGTSAAARTGAASVWGDAMAGSHPTAASLFSWGRPAADAAAPPPTPTSNASTAAAPSRQHLRAPGVTPASAAAPNASDPEPNPVAAGPSSAAAGPHQALGLNPALAHFLKRVLAPLPAAGASPATQQPAAASAPAAAGGATIGPAPPTPTPTPAVAPRGAFWGNVPGLDPSLCVRCRTMPRTVVLLHGATAHLCFCRSCADVFAVGGPCPLCGEPSQKLMNM